MPAKLDLSVAATIKDPELRASLERIGNAMTKATGDPKLASESPSSATIIQFPLFPQETRPVSNDMARSALFSCVQGNKRRWLKNAVLATVGNVRIEFTGEQLNQDDCDTLMQLIFMACNKPLGQFVVVSAYAVLKTNGVSRLQTTQRA